MAETIVDYLDESADKYPKKIAYGDECESITYEELRERTYKIANWMIKKGYEKKPIAIHLEKSVRCVAVMLGVLYSGNYYTVLDVDMPWERIQKVVLAFSPVGIIVDEKYRKQYETKTSQCDVTVYEDLLEGGYDIETIKERKRSILRTDLSQVIFTSGSTGIPKGVMLSHSGVISMAESSVKYFGCNESDVFANQFPFHFVGYIEDVFCTLKTGATDYIIPKSLFFSPKRLVDFIKEKKVTVLFWIASALSLIAKYGVLSEVTLPCVKSVMFAGEQIPVKYLRPWKKALPNAVFINSYGSSESIGAILCYRVNREHEDKEQLPLGVPVEGAETFLIDENGERRKDEGELCIKSNQMAVGYYKNAEETSKKFIKIINESGKETTILKTGDLMKYNERGELIFVGRKDFQIKKRGYRVELGEIEYTVNSIDEIKDAACIYDQHNERIVLFYSGHITDIDLRRFIERVIPHYMLPDIYIKLEEIPRNINMKIDRVRLNGLYEESNKEA